LASDQAKFRIQLCVSTQHKLQLTATIYSYFSQSPKVDPGSIWLDLCLNSDLAKDRYRAFFKAYIKNAVQRVHILGLAKIALKQTITSVNFLLNAWRGIIAKAYITVL
jgi:hypothetical protein